MLRRCRYLAVLSLLLFLASGPIQAESKELVIEPVKDGILLGAGLGAAVLSQLLVSSLEAPSDPIPYSGGINAFDRLALFSYSEQISRAGKVLALVSLGLPAALLLGKDAEEPWPLAVVYLETLCYAFGAKNVLKYLVHRPRPYLYSQSYDGTPGLDWEAFSSFPSGHTTLSFMSATFSTYLYCRQDHGPGVKVLFASLAYGLAGTTAYLRVRSGEHFLTDVLSGAVLGTVVGFIIPRLHLAGGRPQDNPDIVVGPDGLVLRFAY
jgi:membrane-associated phospholipid phosphatase